MKMTGDKFLDWAIELQSLAQTGLEYGHDKFDLERYQRIREIAAEMMSNKSGLPIEKVKNLFCNEVGYQTPKIGTRAAIFKDEKILLVKENNAWALPGGWGDVDQSVADNCIKECKEESGLDVAVDKVIALHDYKRHNPSIHPYGICQIFFLCHSLGGHFEKNDETVTSKYFGRDEIPNLIHGKNTPEQVQMCFDAYHDPNWQTKFE